MSEAVKQPEAETQRLDKWLWVARFFKTRGLAATAISGGKVQVAGVAKHRRPASEAKLLYEETPDSIQRREREAERRRVEAGARRERLGKPSKRDRRAATRLKSGDY
jgi:ribosome-associated heat shock protein Hsp15